MPLLLMGIDEETAKELACRLEDEAQEGSAEWRPYLGTSLGQPRRGRLYFY